MSCSSFSICLRTFLFAVGLGRDGFATASNSIKHPNGPFCQGLFKSFQKVFKRKSIYNIFFRAPTAPGLGDAVFKIMKLADGVSVGIYDHFHSGFARHFYVFVFKVNPPGMSVNLQNRPRALGGFDYRFHIHLVGLPAVYNPARRVKQNIQMRIFPGAADALGLVFFL